jgi:ABC-type glycerol-3-phosphate transport system substrate-binding protein
MKKHFKLITLLITLMIVVGLLGCTQPAEEPVVDEPEVEEPEVEEPEVEEPEVEEPEVEEPVVEEPEVEEPKEPVTIRYAAWNLGTEEENNIFRQLNQAYMDLNPHVTIEVVDMSGEGGWEAILTAYAAKGELPDVFMANNVPLYVQNGWMADLSEHVADDPDWVDVAAILKDSFTYDGKVYGLPSAQFVQGYFVNQDLYEAANLDAPEYGFSIEEWEAAVKDLNNIDQGILGLDEQEFVMGWYSNALNPDLKWFSYDGEKMNYNSPEFKEAVAKTGEMKPYTWQGLSEEQLANFISTGPWELFLNQEVGMRWDASWSVPGYIQNAAFNWDFVGVPGGNQSMVFDAIGVSSTAENLEEAYNFAKWLSFSKEAWLKEVELARALGSAPKMPISVDDDAIEIYKEFVDKPGILMALENLDNSMIESLAKIVPGYINARWEGKPGIDIGEDMDVNMWYMFNFANAGTYKYEDYAAQLEDFANNLIAEATEAMGQ